MGIVVIWIEMVVKWGPFTEVLGLVLVLGGNWHLVLGRERVGFNQQYSNLWCGGLAPVTSLHEHTVSGRP